MRAALLEAGDTAPAKTTETTETAQTVADTTETTDAAETALVRRARSAAATAALHAEHAERTRSLHPDTARALTGAGFARHFVPRRLGGSGGSFTELVHATALVGEECPSAAWWGVLQALHGRLAALLPEAAHTDLWGAGPDVPVAAAVVPAAGELRPVPGGHLLSGRWEFASGVDHAEWVLLASTARTGDGPRPLVAVVSRRDVRVVEPWDGGGLRGTGSHAVAVDDAFVPEHRTAGREVLAPGRRDPGLDRCHALPYPLVTSLLMTLPALGAARGALRAWTGTALGRTTPLGEPLLGTGTAQDVLARSSGETDAAQLLLERAARRADEAPLDDLPVAANQRDAAVALDMLVGAVERLVRHGGARAQRADSPLHRYWRDVHTVAAHGAVQLAPAAAAYGHHVLSGAGKG
ncbi:acyl-CoA dehydrogenase family protein [Streptomyces filamentosus]|uniref:acyl-CoA dehydrogenase family protein n=1 Tax=Streptomyces filamentosus TaxID=67294 RepID=UPI0036EE24CB